MHVSYMHACKLHACMLTQLLAVKTISTWICCKLCCTRETLLGQLSVFIKQTRDSFVQKTNAGGQGIPKGKNVPEAVNNISWVQQLIAKVWTPLVMQ